MYIIAGRHSGHGCRCLPCSKKTSTIAEEKTSGQLDGIDAYILKELGPALEKLSPEEEE